jgi:hypothetical protein
MNSRLELGDRVNDCEGLSNSQGNLEALNVLFLRYRRTLLLVAYRVLGDHNQAEDAVQRCLQSAASRNVSTIRKRKRFPELAGQSPYRRSFVHSPREGMGCSCPQN